jgi:hypothetical protein
LVVERHMLVCSYANSQVCSFTNSECSQCI